MCGRVPEPESEMNGVVDLRNYDRSSLFFVIEEAIIRIGDEENSIFFICQN